MLLAIAAGIIAIYLAIRFLWSAVLAVVVGGAIYYLLGPIVSLLRRLRVPRLLSSLVLAGLLFGALVFGSAKLFPRLYTELQDVVARLPEQVDQVERWLIDQGVLGDEADPRLRSAAQSIFDRSGEIIPGAVLQSLGALRVFFGSLTSILLGLVFGIYLLVGGADLARALPAWIPPDRRDRWTRLGARASQLLASYVRARVIASLFIGGIYWGAFSLIGVPSAALLAVIGGALNFVPVVGPLIAAVPVVTVAAFKGWTTVLAVLGVQLAAQQIESSIIGPLIEGRSVRLPPVVVLLAALVGAALAGIPGLLLAVPVAGLARAALEIFYRDAWEAGPRARASGGSGRGAATPAVPRPRG